jgi:hypothetical protein
LLLLVFHGLARDAGPYRNSARALAERIGAIVVAPKFDAGRFSTDLYQRGRIAGDGGFIPPGRRTVDLIAPLVARACDASGHPDLPHTLLGHSAGGQFLSRVIAFAPPEATRFIVANPSTWVPSATSAVPYGVGRSATPMFASPQAAAAFR